MKTYLFLLLTMLFSCQQEKTAPSMTSSSSAFESKKDNFDDLKPKEEEGCEDDSEEKFAKVMQAEPEEVNLLEGEAGCDTTAEKK